MCLGGESSQAWQALAHRATAAKYTTMTTSVCVLLAASGLLCEIVDLSGTARRVQLVYIYMSKLRQKFWDGMRK